MSPSKPAGAFAARALLLRIVECNDACLAAAGDIGPDQVAALIDEALKASEPRDRRGLLLGLAEFIATALNGSIIDPEPWKPLEFHDRPSEKKR